VSSQTSGPGLVGKGPQSDTFEDFRGGTVENGLFKSKKLTRIVSRNGLILRKPNLEWGKRFKKKTRIWGHPGGTLKKSDGCQIIGPLPYRTFRLIVGPHRENILRER